MASDSRRFSRFLDVLSVVLLAVAVWLFWDARRPVASPTQPAAAGAPSRLVAGQALASFMVADSAGAARPGVVPGGRSQLLFVFRSDCPACAVQKPQWQELASHARERSIPTMAYTPEPLVVGVAGYFGDAPVAVMRFADVASAGEALDLRLVPTTFLLDERGRVLLHHQGVMPPSVLDSIRGLIHNRAEN